MYKFRKYFGRKDFSDQLKNIIHYKRTGYNINVMRQSACLVSRLTTLVASLIALSLVGPTGVQLLGFCCSSISVRVLLLSTHLVSTPCCWILIYMFAVAMHRWVRSPNNLYIFEPLQNLGRGCFFLFVFFFVFVYFFFQRKTG